MGDTSSKDKLLLSGLIIAFVAVMLYTVHRPDLDQTGIIAFCQDMAKLFAGALLTLITGVVLRKANGISPTGGSTNETPSASIPPSPTPNSGSHL